jgi:mRNA-degrading endonuclease RelE of RelBE toxin-antitoxin system
MIGRIRFGDRAKIAIDNLSSKDEQKVIETIRLLEGFPSDPQTRSRVYKLRQLANHFVARAGLKYRIIFTYNDHEITIIDIVHHDRLERLFGSSGEDRR